ncbi:flagellar export chaperone FliS [Solidesulfovibrio alcoholivorans]|uniref:flagellar export chaperone FliS n=1 Tax=Solidesulfovibrio alcoholivorans TaxID=81406 RepID=UPI0004969BC8|nr:flagellar export chaperone FliS [Solidesulfovibrio alcoholivorans]
MQSAARSYFQTQVATTTQGDLLIMLFDAALKFLRQAKEKIAARDYAQKGILISKALDILSELQGTLNAQKGGELADRLQKLYFFCSTRLLAANLKLDISKIDEVMHILTGLRDAFNEANAKVATKVVPTTGVQATNRPAVASAAPYVSQAAAAAAYPAAMAADTPAATPRQPVVPSAGPAPVKTEPVVHVNIPTPIPGSAAPYTKAAPVNRIMAAYAASRAQG